MKQGNMVNVKATKREPITETYSPAATGQIGVQVVVNPVPVVPDGRGYSAPEPVSHTTITSGTQGEH
jgi:hypothetical protein